MSIRAMFVGNAPARAVAPATTEKSEEAVPAQPASFVTRVLDALKRAPASAARPEAAPGSTRPAGRPE